MVEWADQALSALARHPRVAMVTVLAVEGSAPREAGARMIVSDGEVLGTVGGGALEYQITRQARAMLERPAGDWRVQDYPLGPLLGQCCGGRVRVMLERLDPAACGWMTELNGLAGAIALATRLNEGRLVRQFADAGAPPTARGPAPQAGDVLAETIRSEHPRVWIFGAGHVGAALHRALAPLPFDTLLFDTRPDFAPGAQTLGAEAMAAQIGQASARTATLIMTHDHALDFRLAGAALAGEAGFVGLIGSATKRARFLRRLRDRGLDDAALGRLTCPVGLPGIAGKEPEVIAASVAAQLLLLRAARP